MADFEDEGQANQAPVNGLKDDASGFQDSGGITQDLSHFSNKLTDPSSRFDAYSEQPSSGGHDPMSQFQDPSHFSKFDAYSEQPSSMTSEDDYDYGHMAQSGHDPMTQFQDQTKYPPANEEEDFGHYQDERGDDDLPANFAREVARNQNFSDSDNFGEDSGDMARFGDGRGDEADDMIQQGNGSNPFAMEPSEQSVPMGGTSADDRPIMGYNPFLGEENKGEGQFGHGDGAESGEDQFDRSAFKEQGFGDPSSASGANQEQDADDLSEKDDERGLSNEYGRLEEDDDDADLEMDPVGHIQEPELDTGIAEKEEIVKEREELEEEKPEGQSHPSQVDQFIGEQQMDQYGDDDGVSGMREEGADRFQDEGADRFQDEGADRFQDEQGTGQFTREQQMEEQQIGELREEPHDVGYTEDQQELREEPRNVGYTEDEQDEPYRDEEQMDQLRDEEQMDQLRDEEPIDQYRNEQQVDQYKDEHFTADDQQPVSSGFDTEQFHSEMGQQPVEQSESLPTQPGESEYEDASRPSGVEFEPEEAGLKEESDVGADFKDDTGFVGDEQEEREMEEMGGDMREKEVDDYGIVNQGFSDDVDMEGEKVIQEEEEMIASQALQAETTPSADFEDEEKEDQIPAQDEASERDDEINQAENINTGDEEFPPQQQLQPDGDEIKKEEEGSEKGFEEQTGFDSDEKIPQQVERSFVDNMSELTSPDNTIPQPLPSPPEPKDMSPFDPLAPSDSPSPCQEAGGNLGQHETLFQSETVADDNNTGDFLTGEVEGETKFGVDGTAVTSTTAPNNSFLNSEEYEEEEEETEEESQPLDQGGAGTTGTSETSVEEKSGEFGEQGEEQGMENNALMSMSMEGSFYDDGGDLMGGDDRRNENNLQDDAITEESYSAQNSYDDRGAFLNQDAFAQQNSQQIQNDFSQNEDSYQPDQEAFGMNEDNVVSAQDSFDPLSNASAPPPSAINGHEEGGNMGGLDSLLDAPVTATGLQTPVTEKNDTIASMDSTGVDSITREFESSVDAQPPQQDFQAPVEEDAPGESSIDAVGFSSPQQDNDLVQKDLDNGLAGAPISEPAPEEKPEEPSSSVDETPVAPAIIEEQNAAAPAAAAASAVAPAAAAAASPTKKSTTTAKRPTSAKAGTKTTTTPGAKTTTTTTTKTTRETKTTNNRTPATKTSPTKKTEVTTTTTTRTTPRKPPGSRPTSASTTSTTTERKTSAKTATSPTKSASTPGSAKPSGPLPSYAQPITPRKPREAKVPTPEEKKKATPRPPSASRTTTPRTPRPQSATTGSSSATSRTTTRTTTTPGSTTRTPTSRPKSSPTKLSNGTGSDNKSPTKKYGIDSRNESYKPGGGNVKITNAKATPGSKTSTPCAAGARSPTKTTSPRTPKTGEVKSKIGSLNNATHSPGGGNVKIATKKTDFSNVTSRIGSKDKIDHKPGGGNVKIQNAKVKVEAKSKIGSLDNATHKPTGGDKKIESKKLEWKVESKIGSLDNAKHVAGGGDKKIETKKVEWNARSRIRSLENASHVPGGGDKKIEVQKTDWKAESKIGSLDNAKHKPGGGDKQIESHKLDFNEKASPKIGSLDKERLHSGSDDGATELKPTNGATSEN